jgi:predicted  nucleic acid-binding Zn-ribbon protein
MVVEWLQKLLILQDRDSRCDGIQRQLDALPTEIASEEASIKSFHEKLAAVEQEAKELEVRRLDLEGEVELTEAAIVKYKTQQMQVKKNEEYTALQNEIDTLKKKISDLEDTELQILEEIDLKAAELATAREKTDSQEKTLQAHIALMRQNYESFASELEDARKAVEDCKEDIKPGILQQYTYVKGQVKRPPVVVPLEDGRCMGCHLKVSGEVESASRKGHELVRCDSCGRILYFDR